MVVDAFVLNMWLYVLAARKPRYAGGRPPQRVKPFCLDGMSTSRAIGAVSGYAAIALAIAVDVEGFVVADVQLALARMAADDSATWPNMAPQVRYFFIPVVADAVVVAAVAVNLLLTLIDHHRTELLRHWVFLGAAYSLVASALPMRKLGLSISALHKRRLG